MIIIIIKVARLLYKQKKIQKKLFSIPHKPNIRNEAINIYIYI